MKSLAPETGHALLESMLDEGVHEGEAWSRRMAGTGGGADLLDELGPFSAFEGLDQCVFA
jgi:hypothetical protein